MFVCASVEQVPSLERTHSVCCLVCHDSRVMFVACVRVCTCDILSALLYIIENMNSVGIYC